MVLGKLLDRVGIVFLAYCSSAGCLAHHSALFADHWTDSDIDSTVCIYVRAIVGNRRPDLWAWSTLLRRRPWQQHYSWSLYGVWLANSFYLLPVCSSSRKGYHQHDSRQ